MLQNVAHKFVFLNYKRVDKKGASEPFVQRQSERKRKDKSKGSWVTLKRYNREESGVHLPYAVANMETQLFIDFCKRDVAFPA